MIFAAGRGTRLRPLTDTLPKALVEVGAEAMLGRTAQRLIEAGADRLIVNLHPFPEAIEAYVRARDDFGVEVFFSLERDAPLETGGGLLAAREHFRGDAPFFLHNADVLTDLSLDALYAAHARSGALVTLAVMERPSTRGLLFDDAGLCGRADDERELRLEVRPCRGETSRLAFAGVHVASPALLERITERGAFPILDVYLRLAAKGARILPHRVDGCAWIDIGRPADLRRARALTERTSP